MEHTSGMMFTEWKQTEYQYFFVWVKLWGFLYHKYLKLHTVLYTQKKRKREMFFTVKQVLLVTISFYTCLAFLLLLFLFN